MTAVELIEKLKLLPPETAVIVWGAYDDAPYMADELSVSRMNPGALHGHSVDLHYSGDDAVPAVLIK